MGLKYWFFVLAYFAVLASGKQTKRKKIETSLSGVVNSRVKWRQEDVNVVSSRIDISKHSLSMPPVVFTSLTSRSFMPSSGIKLDMSFLDEFALANVTGKYFPEPQLTTKDSFSLVLGDLDGNKTAASANSANYKIKYLMWTKQHPSEEALLEKYEDELSSKDYHALAKLSYLDFLAKYFKEEKEVIKPLLGKDYVKVLKTE